jgi:hypothetical protein
MQSGKFRIRNQMWFADFDPITCITDNHKMQMDPNFMSVEIGSNRIEVFGAKSNAFMYRARVCHIDSLCLFMASDE